MTDKPKWEPTQETLAHAKWLSDFWGNVSKGFIPQRMTMFGGSIEWDDLRSNDMGPGLQANPEYFRTVRGKKRFFALLSEGSVLKISQDHPFIFDEYEEMGGASNPYIEMIRLVEQDDD